MILLKEIKKNMCRKYIVMGLCFLILGILLMVVAFDGVVAIAGHKTNLYDASVKEISNSKYAKVEIDKYNLYGVFTEEYETKNNVKKITAYYCALLVGEESDLRLMAVKVDAKYKSKLDKIAKEYTDLDNGIDSDERTVIEVKGQLSEMNKIKSSLYRYFKDFVKDYGYEDEDIPFVSLNLCLEYKSVGGQMFIFVLGAIAVIVAICVMIYILTTGGVSKIKKQLYGMGQAELDRLDNDYINSIVISKWVRIGRYYTFIMNVGKIIKNDELVWAYMSKVQHRTNGIPTGTTYSVLAYDVNAKSITIPAKNELMCQTILDQFAQISDKIILGYSEEYMQLFRTDFKRFLSIAYNRIDNVPSNENGGGMGFDNYFS